MGRRATNYQLKPKIRQNDSVFSALEPILKEDDEQIYDPALLEDNDLPED
jgi:hypothetical protein